MPPSVAATSSALRSWTATSSCSRRSSLAPSRRARWAAARADVRPPRRARVSHRRASRRARGAATSVAMPRAAPATRTGRVRRRPRLW